MWAFLFLLSLIVPPTAASPGHRHVQLARRLGFEGEPGPSPPFARTGNLPGSKDADFVGTVELSGNVVLKQYAGYLTSNATGGNYLYYQFFENQELLNNEKQAPVALWLNGGPSASSLLGLYMENGPLRISSDGWKNATTGRTREPALRRHRSRRWSSSSCRA